MLQKGPSSPIASMAPLLLLSVPGGCLRRVDAPTHPLYTQPSTPGRK